LNWLLLVLLGRQAADFQVRADMVRGRQVVVEDLGLEK
jgi:hypothetical protein